MRVLALKAKPKTKPVTFKLKKLKLFSPELKECIRTIENSDTYYVTTETRNPDIPDIFYYRNTQLRKDHYINMLTEQDKRVRKYYMAGPVAILILERISVMFIDERLNIPKPRKKIKRKKHDSGTARIVKRIRKK